MQERYYISLYRGNICILGIANVCLTFVLDEALWNHIL